MFCVCTCGRDFDRYDIKVLEMNDDENCKDPAEY